MTSGSPRERVLDAVFRLVAQGGLTEASLRKVAAESGVNIGSVRHYYGTHEQLMIAAAEDVGRRMERRLNAVWPADLGESDVAARRELVESVCRAVLPTGRDDRVELVVLLELVAAARLRPEFRPLATRMGKDLRAVLVATLETVGVKQAALEAERLTALVIGLTTEFIYPHGLPDDDVVTRVLRHHIAELLPD
jgi:AcrR family transcriptional regulator